MKIAYGCGFVLEHLCLLNVKRKHHHDVNTNEYYRP